MGNLDVLLDEVRMKLIAMSLLKLTQLGTARYEPQSPVECKSEINMGTKPHFP